jgi:hypothetical protein
MSVLRPLLSMRGRLALLASALLLMTALVAAPSVSGAAPARVKQFVASIDPTTGISGDSGTWTVQVTNCALVSPCTASSTIGLGSIQITLPIEFRNSVTVSIAGAPTGKHWTVSSYNSSTGIATIVGVTGSDKLQPGESVFIAIHATPTTTTCPPTPFTTSAWGSASVPGTEPFLIKSAQPTVTVAPPSGVASEGCLENGGSVTDPETGQIDTVSGDFQGHVIVAFGGEGPDCGSDADFGALGNQWQVYHQATPSTLTPAGDFIAGGPKIWTSEFPLLTAPGGPDADSSWYLTCYAVPQAGHPRFETRGDGLAVEQTVGGVISWVGILASCADAPRPCVSEQFLTTGPTPPGPPWTPADNMVHIAITVDPGDPHRS